MRNKISELKREACSLCEEISRGLKLRVWYSYDPTTNALTFTASQGIIEHSFWQEKVELDAGEFFGTTQGQINLIAKLEMVIDKLKRFKEANTNE